MSFTANVYKIMIASPGDVEEERRIAREVICRWNDLHSEEKGVILLPVGWETHSHPQHGDRPQAIINKQILEPCDLLIGILWTKLGSPTGKHISGTVEEITEHAKAGKPMMVYFSDKEIKPSKLNKAQYEALEAFREEYGKTSLYATCSDENDFRTKLRDHLTQTVNEGEWFKGASLSDDEQSDLLLQDAVPSEPKLSEEAKTILTEAAQDSRGCILSSMSSSGFCVKTNGRNLVGNPHDPRCHARWQSAMGELQEKMLITSPGWEGEAIRLTVQGYKIADSLLGEKQA